MISPRIPSGRLVAGLRQVVRAVAALAGWVIVMSLGGLRVQAQVNVAEEYLFAAANQERLELGLAPLLWDDALAAAAGAHARVMAENREISHRFEGEAELSVRGSAAGARFTLISENVGEAPLATEIHEAWMKSQGHRENLLDQKVTAVGIAVVMRNHQLYAVQDFARMTQALSLEDQEATVRRLLARSGLSLLATTSDTRLTCATETGFAGSPKPGFIMRYSATSLDRLPDELLERLKSKQYRSAAVGACDDHGANGFSGYRLAVLLYF